MLEYSVYIITNKRNGTLYIGVTNNLCRRVYEHKSKLIEGFSKKHSLNILVYSHVFSNIEDAVYRETQLKRWNRAWKLRLIEENNPQWLDLYQEYCE